MPKKGCFFRVCILTTFSAVWNLPRACPLPALRGTDQGGGGCNELNRHSPRPRGLGSPRELRGHKPFHNAQHRVTGLTGETPWGGLEAPLVWEPRGPPKRGSEGASALVSSASPLERQLSEGKALSPDGPSTKNRCCPRRMGTGLPAGTEICWCSSPHGGGRSRRGCSLRANVMAMSGLAKAMLGPREWLWHPGEEIMGAGSSDLNANRASVPCCVTWSKCLTLSVPISASANG